MIWVFSGWVGIYHKTRLVQKGLRELIYNERLKATKLPTIEESRESKDLITALNFLDQLGEQLLKRCSTRDHDKKLEGMLRTNLLLGWWMVGIKWHVGQWMLLVYKDYLMAWKFRRWGSISGLSPCTIQIGNFIKGIHERVEYDSRWVWGNFSFFLRLQLRTKNPNIKARP